MVHIPCHKGGTAGRNSLVHSEKLWKTIEDFQSAPRDFFLPFSQNNTILDLEDDGILNRVSYVYELNAVDRVISVFPLSDTPSIAEFPRLPDILASKPTIEESIG
jgi:hypothetical protein